MDNISSVGGGGISPSSSGSNRVENGVWYLDYMSWDPSAIPQGVNTVNIFVSGIQKDPKTGEWTVGGLEGFHTASLKNFIEQCHAKNIQVKFSIGGNGGKYDKCWDCLDGKNTAAVAKGLVAFCQQYNLDGIDFDYEENQEGAGVPQEKLVGQLIKSFKDQDPHLLASLCTCAGESWQQAAKVILDQTLDATGKTAIDHLYIMSYAGTTKEVETWCDHWAAFLAEYKLSPSAATMGIAQNATYDVDALAKYAASKGYSTMIWNYNPSQQSSSDAFSRRIWSDYYSK